MNTSHRTYLPRLAIGLAAPLLALPVLAERGTQWEYKGSMQVMGMQMPTGAVRVCSKEGEEMAAVDKLELGCTLSYVAGHTEFPIWSYLSCAETADILSNGYLRH